MKNYIRLRRGPLCRQKSMLLSLGAMALVTSYTSTAFAQEEDEDDIFVLSPFEVDTSDDDGWRSTNSTSGTTLNTAIKDIPMSIEVINSDFLDDMQAETFDEAMEYSAGVNLVDHGIDTGNSGPNEVGSSEKSSSVQGGLDQAFTNGINIRGFNVAFQNRLGFRYGGSIASFGVNMGGYIDNVNTGRMEVVRGPNSLLYGIGVLSGIVNVIPKRPLSTPTGSVSIGVGSNGYYRRTFDWTAPLVKDFLGGDLSYRFAMAETRDGSEKEVFEENRDYFVGQLEFRSDQLNVFLEVQKADVQRDGIGGTTFSDKLGSVLDKDFRNEYYEPYKWNEYFASDGDYFKDRPWISDPGYHESLRGLSDLSDDQAYDLTYLDGIDSKKADIAAVEAAGIGTLNTNEYAQYLDNVRIVREYDRGYELYENAKPYDRNFSIVGSDAYESLDETDVTLDVNYTPFENFSLSFGTFLTDVRQEKLTPSLGMQGNSGYRLTLNNALTGLDRTNYLAARAVEGELTEEQQADIDIYEKNLQRWDDYIYMSDNPLSILNPHDPYTNNTDYRDYRTATYSWSFDPKETSTEQYRIRASYSFETPDFFGGSNAKHTITSGVSYIHDVADFTGGSSTANGSKEDYLSGYGTASTFFPADNATIHPRSITDFSPIVLNEDDSIRMAGDRAWHVDVWYRSAYAIYKGDFLDEKLSLLAGWRYDEYFTRARLWDRFDENAPIGGEANYSDFLVKMGYVDAEGNAQITADPWGEVYRPNAQPLNEAGITLDDPGTIGYNFRYYPTISEYGPGTKPSSETGVTLAMNYDITDDLTVYAVSSGGVTPNIGLVDGNQQPHPSEKSKNLEIGLKFELFDSKLSGTISAYEITRENAVWTARGAPNPSGYYGSIYTLDETGVPKFDATRVKSGEYEINYSVHSNVFDDVWKAALTEAKEIDPTFSEERSDLDVTEIDVLENGEKDYSFRSDNLYLGTGRIKGYNYDENGVAETPFTDDQLEYPRGVFEKYDEYTYLSYNNLDGTLVALADNGYTQIRFTGEEYRHEVQPGPRKSDGSAIPQYPDVNIYYIPVKRTFRDVLETAYADRERSDEGVDADFRNPEQYNPMTRSPHLTQPGWEANTSAVSQADVTFTDVSTGYDIQLIYNATKSWKFTFNYAHTQREAQGAFLMVDPALDVVVTNSQGENGVDFGVSDDGILTENEYWGTEFDSFARIFGRENFGLEEVYYRDPDTNEILLDTNGNPRVEAVLKNGEPVGVGDVRASEATGGIDGLSLYYGYEDSASFVQNYTFHEGLLKDLSISLGLIYQGPANTSIPIGGNDLAENLYPTPPTEERIYSNLNLSYSWKWGDFPIKAALRVSNLGNDIHSENIVEYKNIFDGSIEKRRSEQFFAPRSYRFNLSTTF